jgi:hypothetical protein
VLAAVVVVAVEVASAASVALASAGVSMAVAAFAPETNAEQQGEAQEKEKESKARQAAAERRYREVTVATERQRRRVEVAESSFCMEVDNYCRSHKRFDSTQPTAAVFSFAAVVAACARDEALIPDALKCLTECCVEDRSRRFKLASVDKPGGGCRYMIQLNCLTPYQGGDRRFGTFVCKGCAGRLWVSCASWANKWQKCNKCDAEVYPRVQEPLKDGAGESEDDGDRAPHDQRRCEKCISLGSLCLKWG